MKKFLLLLVAIILALVCVPVGSIFTICKAVFTWNGKKMFGFLSNSAYSLALAIDHFGNVVDRDLFNGLLIGRGGYGFGNIQETVSSVLGKNQQRGTLTATGRGLVWILDKLDPGHCINSIMILPENA